MLIRLAALQLSTHLAGMILAAVPKVPKDWPDPGPRGGEALPQIERAPRNCLCRLDELFVGRVCTSDIVFEDNCLPIAVIGLGRNWRSPTGSCPHDHRCVPTRTDRDGRPRVRCSPLDEDDIAGRAADRKARRGKVRAWAGKIVKSATAKVFGSRLDASSIPSHRGQT